MLVPLVVLPLAVPFLALFTFSSSLTVTMIAATMMNFLLGMSIAPCMAVALGMAPARMRALSSTLVLAGTGLIGAALAPAIVGVISDAVHPRLGAESLRYAIAAIIPAPAIAALFLWRAYRQLGRDAASFDQGERTSYAVRGHTAL